jgi:hypothetical protein
VKWRLRYLNEWKDLVEIDFDTLDEVFTYIEEVKPKSFKCYSIHKD